jgi:signal peptidase II
LTRQQRLVSIYISITLGILAFGLDRGHKYFQIEIQGWRGGEIIPVTSFFDYVLVWNTGISYGLLASVPVAVLGLIMVAAIIALSLWWWRANTMLLQAGLALAIGGALSNALDRLLYGAVADFFHFHVGGNSFYIFNIADAAITLGVLLLILDLLGIGRDKTIAEDQLPPAN